MYATTSTGGIIWLEYKDSFIAPNIIQAFFSSDDSSNCIVYILNYFLFLSPKSSVCHLCSMANKTMFAGYLIAIIYYSKIFERLYNMFNKAKVNNPMN